MINIGSFFLMITLCIQKIKIKSTKLYYIFLIKLLIIFSLYIQIGYFFQIGSFQFEYSEVLMFILVLMGIPFFKKEKVPVISWFVLWGLCISIALAYLSLIFSQQKILVLPSGGSWDQLVWGNQHLTYANFTISNIMKVLRMAIFLILFWIMDRFLLNERSISDDLKKFIVNSGIFFAFVAIVEQITKTLFHSTIFLDITTNVFGVAESQVVKNFERGGIFALQGLTFEPSVFVLSFLPAILILLTSNLFNEKQKLLKLILFLYVIISSGSFGGFALVSFFIGVYLFVNKKLIFVKISSFLIIIIGFIILMSIVPTFSNLSSYYVERIFSIVNGTGIGSETSRLYSVSVAMNAFKGNPFFGIGLGTLDVHGFIPTLLSNFGIIGIIFLILVLFRGSVKSKPKNILIFIYMIPFLYLTGSLRMVYSLHIIILFLLVFRELKNEKYFFEDSFKNDG